MAGNKGAQAGSARLWIGGGVALALAVVAALVALLRPADPPPAPPAPLAQAPAPVAPPAVEAAAVPEAVAAAPEVAAAEPAAEAAEAAAPEAAAPEVAEAAPVAEAAAEAVEPAATESVAAEAVQPAVPAETASAPEPVATAVPEPAPPPAAPDPEPVPPPAFDVVRIAPDGGATIAGRAQPGAQIAVMVDAAPMARTRANAAGQFVLLFTLPPADQGRLMTLVMTLPDGSQVVSSDQVILAPADPPPPPPEAMAAAAPEPAPALEPAPAPEPAPETAPEATPVAEAPAVAPAEPAPQPAPPEAPAALLLSADGVRVLQSGSQDAAAPPRVTIDAISYTPEGEVRLAGRGNAGMAVRLYLDNAALTDLPVADDGGWGDTVPGIAPGLYTLRADMIDAQGRVAARFETPFRRETPERLAQAAGLRMPGADAVAVPVTAAEPTPAAEAPAAEAPAAPAPVAQAPATPAPAAPAPLAEAPPAIAPLAPAAPAAPSPPPVAASPAPPAPVAPVTVTVQPGFTLWGIAQDRFGSGFLYVQVFEANRDQIRNPDLIYPGQVFTLPELAE